jgi:nucleotide-binding universal stress UspA family protein
MMKLEKILLPVEFENPSRSVTHQAASLAQRFNMEIILLNVLTPLSYAAASLEGGYVPKSREDLMTELVRQARKNLDVHLEAELRGLRVRRILREGDPAHEIVQCAQEENVSLIMMPTHAYGAFKRFVLGSVTARVLHDSLAPVWTGSHLEAPWAAPFKIEHIVCGIDLGPHSLKTLQCANHFATAFGSNVALVHITPVMDMYQPAPEWKVTLAGIAAQEIEKLQASAGTKAQVVIDSGDVSNQLNQAARNLKADLLVVGRNPSYLGGTGYGIIRESNVPVLSIRAASPQVQRS